MVWLEIEFSVSALVALESFKFVIVLSLRIIETGNNRIKYWSEPSILKLRSNSRIEGPISIDTRISQGKITLGKINGIKYSS